MTHTHFVLPLFLLAALASSGCEHSSSLEHAAPISSSVKILSTSPSTAAPLHIGEHVKLQVEVAYTLSADSGTLNLVAQSADDSGVAYDTEVVTKGTGQTKLEAEFVVPNTKTIQVFTPMSAKGQTSTSTVDMWAFKVVPK